MEFKKQRKLLKEFTKSIDDRFEHINKAIAQYINIHYDITAISEDYSTEKLELIELDVKADHSLHNEYVFLNVEMDRQGYLTKSFISDCSAFIYNYKGMIIEEIMEEYELFNEDIYELYEKDILLDVYDLTEAFEDYLYSVFGKEYADMIKDELVGEYWYMKDKKKDKQFWKSKIKEDIMLYAEEELKLIKEG